VAKLARVDPSLVSRVVNNDPKASAGKETRQRIMDAVEELGYSASHLARGLRTSKTSTVGLLLPDISNPMYASIVTGVESRARELGYGLALGIHVEGAQEDTFVQMLRQARVDGLLVASGALTDDFLRQVASQPNGPVVLVNRRVKGVRSSVVVDDAAGALLAVTHLTELGHSRVGGLFGPSSIDTSVRRKKGFMAGCREAGIDPLSVEMPNWRAEDGYQGALSMLTSRHRPTAIFASTLTMGMGVLRAAHELDISAPDELSVIALHDSYIADYLLPTLTTVELPTAAMGSAAVDQLLSLLDGGAHKQLVIPQKPALVLRQSTARLRT
jgi:LacI family transcriptional regulator